MKAPAFQWYPKDYLTDENVVLMTLEEEGAYRRLMDYCWLQGSLPNDMKALAAMCKNVTPERMAELFFAIGRCFTLANGRLYHPRLEREKQAQLERREAKQKAGKKGAKARWGNKIQDNGSAMVLPMAKNGSSSASASASADKELLSDFEEVWGLARKGSKKQAIAQYRKAVPKKVDHATLLEARRKHVEAQPDHIAHLFRWIRDERWTDEYGRPDSRPRGLGGQSLRSQLADR